MRHSGEAPVSSGKKPKGFASLSGAERPTFPVQSGPQTHYEQQQQEKCQVRVGYRGLGKMKGIKPCLSSTPLHSALQACYSHSVTDQKDDSLEVQTCSATEEVGAGGGAPQVGTEAMQPQTVARTNNNLRQKGGEKQQSCTIISVMKRWFATADCPGDRSASHAANLVFFPQRKMKGKSASESGGI